jgi:hypothetical protein
MSYDAALEAAINRVGRDKVFARSREVGWRYGDSPPKWVWWGIVAELDAASRPNESERFPVT